MPQQIIPLFPATGVDAAKIQDFPVSTTDPIDGQALLYRAATRQWGPETIDVPDYKTIRNAVILGL